MLRNASIAAILCASLASGWAPATAAAERFRTAQSDEAPAPVRQINPSKAEPMMLGPTKEENAQAYRRDYLACDSEGGDGQSACRDAVDEEYRPEVTGLAGDCDALDDATKADCLKKNPSKTR